jgi:hypothetical protein
MVILGLSLVLEGWATYKNIVELNKRRKGKPFFRYLSDSKDSDLVVVFGENSAAVLGLALALASPSSWRRHRRRIWDGIGSLASSASCWSAWPCSSPTRSSR